jgi:hypothetical protein
MSRLSSEWPALDRDIAPGVAATVMRPVQNCHENWRPMKK